MVVQIYKYKLKKEFGPQQVEVPIGAHLIKVGVQQYGHGSEIFFWAGVDTTQEEKVTHTLQVVATGQDVPPNGIYIDTVFDGPFVWHIFENATEEPCLTR